MLRKPEGKRILERPKRRREGILCKVGLVQIGFDDDWINLDEDRIGSSDGVLKIQQ